MKSGIILLLLLFLTFSCKKAPLQNTNPSSNIPTNLTEVGQLLDSLHVEDQKYRAELDGIIEEFGWNSKEMSDQWEIISAADARNLVIVEGILAQHGWLGSDEIGSTANSTLFLVIQHSDQETQEKYLPMMQQAVKDGKARARSLALLEDRVGLGKGELQIYGSQIGTDQETGEMYVLPLFEPETVNERRLQVGLGPIEDYIGHWDLEWDVEAYKKKLPEYIEQLKSQTR